MKKLVVCFIGLVCTTSMNAEAFKPIKVPFNELPKAEQEARIATARANKMRRTGGEIEKPNSQQGKILIVNSQKIVPSEGLAKAVEKLKEKSRLNIEFTNANEKISVANAGDFKVSSGADIVIFLNECENSPMILNALDDGWVIVNAKAVTEGPETTFSKRLVCVKKCYELSIQSLVR